MKLTLNKDIYCGINFSKVLWFSIKTKAGKTIEDSDASILIKFLNDLDIKNKLKHQTKTHVSLTATHCSLEKITCLYEVYAAFVYYTQASITIIKTYDD